MVRATRRLRLAFSVLLATAVMFPVAAFAQSSTITLAWDVDTDPTVTGYILSWGPAAGTYTSSVDVGNVVQYTVTGLDPNRRYAFAVQAYSTAGLTSAYSTPVSNTGFIVQTGLPVVDIHPGLFWHNDSSGQISTWMLSGPAVLDTRAVSIDRVADTHWFVAAIGDFNGDGYPDVLWRNSTDGSLAAWLLQGNQVIATQYLSISHMPDPAWRIAGAGDVDGDGFADLVWQNSTTGALAVWFLRGTTVVSTRFLSIPKVSSNNWQIVAVGDLNGDGCADLIWREQTQGWVAAWFLQGTTVTYQALMSPAQVPDLAWKIVAAGNPGGTGVPTVVWQNANDGSVAFWYMRGITLIGSTFTNPAVVTSPGWKIVGSR